MEDELHSLFFIGVFLSIGDFMVVFLADLGCIAEADGVEQALDVDDVVSSKGVVLANSSSERTGLDMAASSFWWSTRRERCG